MFNKITKAKKFGMTLIEVVVALAIAGVIGGISIAGGSGVISSARASKVNSQLNDFVPEISTFMEETSYLNGIVSSKENYDAIVGVLNTYLSQERKIQFPSPFSFTVKGWNAAIRKICCFLGILRRSLIYRTW